MEYKVIETNNLTKLYNGKPGCREICLSVNGGQIFGFLGPNGAGKSTLIKMLVGLLFPTSGGASLLGKPLGDLEARRKIGFLPENFSYHQWLTGYELLEFHGSLYRMDKKQKYRRIPEILELVGLTEKTGQKVGSYSKGMQQRIGLACALLPDPELIFLDEPTSALDPIGRRDVREIIKLLKDQGKTVFLNSHLLSEVEMVSDHVAIIKRGRIIASGSIEELQAGKTVVEVTAGGISDNIMEKLAVLGEIKSSGNSLEISVARKEDIPRIARTVVEGGGELFSMTSRRHSLEDLFVSLVEGGVTGVDHSGSDI